MFAGIATLAGCGGDGGSSNTAPAASDTPLANLAVDAGSPIVPIFLPASYFGDGDGDALTFHVEFEGSGLIYDDAGQRISGTVAPNAAVTVTVTAADGKGGEFRDQFTITGETPSGNGSRPAFNDHLVFERSAVEGRQFAHDATVGFAAPGGNGGLTYAVEFTRKDSGLSFDSDTNMISGTFMGSEDVVAIVTVTNGSEGNGVSVEHRILISPGGPPNSNPVVSDTPLADATAVHGMALASAIDLRAGFDDPDGDNAGMTFAARVIGEGGVLTELETFGLTLNGSTLSGQPTRPGNIPIRVTAIDGLGGTAIANFTISVAAPNRDPTALGSAPESVVLIPGEDANLPIALDDWFRDPEGDDLTYSATVDGTPLSRAGIGLMISDNGIIGEFSGNADRTVVVTADDGHGGMATHTFTIVFNPGAVSVDRGIENQILAPDETLELAIPENAFATSAGGTLTYVAAVARADGASLPIGASATNAVPFAFDGRALTSSESGSGGGWTIRVTANDGSGSFASTEFNVGFSLPTGARTALPSWLADAEEYGIGFDTENIDNPINGVHSLVDSDSDARNGGAEQHWAGSGRHDEPVSLTWSFAGLGATLYRGSGSVSPDLYTTTTEEFTDARKEFIRGVFDHVETFSGITFTEVRDPTPGNYGDINIILGSRSMFGSRPDVLGFTYGPTGQGSLSPLETTRSDRFSHIGDIYIVSDYLPEDAYESPFGEENYVIAHELLHGLGLDHPFNESAGTAAGFHGYHETGPSDEDPAQNVELRNYSGQRTGGAHETPLSDTFVETIMTYHNPFSGSPLRVSASYVAEPDNNDIWQPSLYDIATLQHLYGANFNHEAGDTEYDFDGDTLTFQTIWDGGGVDWISHSGEGDATIDLTPGSGSTVGFFGGANYRFSAEGVSGVPGATWTRFELDEDSDGMVTFLDDRGTALFIPNLAADGLDESLVIRYGIDAGGDTQRSGWRFDTREFVDRSYATHNVTIAHGVVIENASGGDGNDRIIGNSADNILMGGGGSDAFEIFANPAPGTDIIGDFDASEDLIEFTGFSADQVLLASDDEGHAVFTAPGMRLTLTDVSPGELTAGVQYFFHDDPDTNRIFVNGDGNERFGGLGDDIIVSEGDDNRLEASDGDDVITSVGDGNELDGGFGDDTLTSSGENNNMRGGPGDDTFRIVSGTRSVTIEDFVRDRDMIEFVGPAAEDISGRVDGTAFVLSGADSGIQVRVEGAAGGLIPRRDYIFSPESDPMSGGPARESSGAEARESAGTEDLESAESGARNTGDSPDPGDGGSIFPGSVDRAGYLTIKEAATGGRIVDFEVRANEIEFTNTAEEESARKETAEGHITSIFAAETSAVPAVAATDPSGDYLGA